MKRERLDELHEMGLIFNDQSYVGKNGNKDINFHYTEIQCDSDDTWERKINKVKEEIQRRKNK